MKAFKPIYLFPLVTAGLILGIAGGFVRLGYMNWNISGTAAQHGLLMVGGFLGTLITLERAMVMKNRRWLFVAFLSGASIPVLLLPGWDTVGHYLLFLANIGLLTMTYLQSIRNPASYQYVISIGAASLLLGNFTVINTGFIPAGVPWWMGFLLFTIVGERLELSKFLPTPAYARALLYMLLGLFFLGMWLPFHATGTWIMGGSVIFIGVWLLRYDMANVAAKKDKLFKYVGVGLKVGYVWLILNGIVLCFFAFHPLFYDIYIHTFFLGFTFSMIWAHAPIILPMILGIQEKLYHPILWIGWTLFQLSLLGRILSSLLKLDDWRVLYGIFNGWNILGMFVLMGFILFIRVWYSRSVFNDKKQVGNQLYF
ncbi:MAG TPA: hypothetical protein VK957_21040 [Lunatimonas sp.]|nr:hypothetical protein [Lunatimonas sp.]